MKLLLKNILGFVLCNNLNFWLLRSVCSRQFIILYYHRVIRKEERKDVESSGMCVNIDSFDKQMDFLKKYYNFVSEDDIIEAIEDRKKLSDYSVWITFDDGYEDNYKNAYPILKKYNIPATFFVTTGYINKTAMPSTECGKPIFMNWQEIKEVTKGTISIGAHTVSHRILSHLSDAELEKEIFDAKNEVEQRLGKKVISFAYPRGKVGDYNLEECIPVLKKNNFKLAVTAIGGSNDLSPGRTCFNLRRMGISYEDSLNFFKFKVSLGSFWQR